MKRRMIIVLCFVVVIFAALAVLERSPFVVSKSLNADGFSQIQLGMAESEVKTLLGGPAGNYGHYAGETSMMTKEGYDAAPGSIEKIWCDDNNRFEIYFDA